MASLFVRLFVCFCIIQDFPLLYEVRTLVAVWTKLSSDPLRLQGGDGGDKSYFVLVSAERALEALIPMTHNPQYLKQASGPRAKMAAP